LSIDLSIAQAGPVRIRQVVLLGGARGDHATLLDHAAIAGLASELDLTLERFEVQVHALDRVFDGLLVGAWILFF